MARLIGLLIALTLVAGAMGFYLGRHTSAQSKPQFASPKVTKSRIAPPIANLNRKALTDTYNETRGTDRRHEAQDIVAPRGTPVLAVDDGIVKKLFLSKPGGITLYQFDPSERYCYYYAHLDSYAPGIV